MGETLSLSPKTHVHNINRILDSLRARSRNAISRSFRTGCSTLVNQLENCTFESERNYQGSLMNFLPSKIFV